MKKLVDGLQKIQIAIGGLFLLIFLVVVVYQIICRYMGVAAMWTEDVSMYSFIWAVFMGAGAMVHSNAHFAFSSLIDSMKNEKAKLFLQIIIDLIVYKLIKFFLPKANYKFLIFLLLFEI